MRPHPDIAPRWHTATLLGLYLAVALLGTLLQRGGHAVSAATTGASRVVAQYIPLVLVQVAMAVYVCRVGRAESAFSALIGTRWRSASRAAGDVGLAALGLFAIMAVEQVGARGSAASVAALLPQTTFERAAWAVTAVVVGVSEELVFRGYFLKQWERFSGSAVFAVTMQAAVFGLAHAEQGPSAMVRVAVDGVVLGVMARARGSLLPGMLCHVAVDVLAGVLG